MPQDIVPTISEIVNKLESVRKDMRYKFYAEGVPQEDYFAYTYALIRLKEIIKDFKGLGA